MQFSVFAKRAVLLTFLVISFAAGGCVRMAHPVLRDDQVTSNDSLLGKWVSKDGKVSAELRPGDTNKYKLIYTNEDGKPSNFIVRFGKIGDVSVAEISADALTDSQNAEYKSLVMPLYTLVVIEKTSPDLVLRGPSMEWYKKYSQAHPEELSVNNAEDLVLQANTDDFQVFFTKHIKDDGTLSDPATFTHPADKALQPGK